MILLTSAYGNVGQRMARVLVQKGLDVKAFDINPKTESLLEKGVKEVYVGDISNPEDVRKALQGCDKVLYVPTFLSENEDTVGKQFIDIAVEEGVSQYVLVTVTHTNMSTLMQHTAKAHIEEHLVYKGLTDGLNYTILQPMHYYHNFNVRQVIDTNALVIFYDLSRKLSFVDCEDVAEVAAKVLMEDSHNAATYELVGDEFLSSYDLVIQFNELTGRNVSAVQTSVEDLVRNAGIKDPYTIKAIQALSDTYSNYGLTGNSHVLTWLLGRKPTTFKEYLDKELKIL